MAVGTPDKASQVEDRIKADVQREAPDSNPYLTVHWLRSLIAGIARRIFDFYLDLNRVETRLFPDTADDETATRWGNIFVGPKNPATNSSGQLVATGTVGGSIGIGVSLTAGGKEYITTTADVIAANSISVSSITRSGTTATVTTTVDHNLSSFVPVTISGADQAEYNITDAAIVVTGLNTFTYEVAGSPATPATGTILAGFTTANVNVESVDAGANTNLDLDTAVALSSPIVDVDNTFYVTYGTIGGGTDEETLADYKERYLDRIRNPIAQFNPAAIEFIAKTVSGVTRVFIEEAGTVIGTVSVSSITRTGNIATVTTSAPNNFESGQEVTITGADQPEYNVTDERIIVESTTIFHFVVSGTPATPATGTIEVTDVLPPGQVKTYFMRDNDIDPIPSASEVAAVKTAIDSIKPANTASADNFVLAPTGVDVNFIFTNLTPDTTTMRAAVQENLTQFFEEQTEVGVNVDEDAYRAAIKNTVDPDTGDVVATFTLSSPSGDIAISSGEIAILGTISYV